MSRGRNRRAVAETVRALTSAGRLEPIDRAVVVAAEALADAVDASPDNASLWREFRAALADLREVGRDDHGDDIGALLDGLRAEVGDSSQQSPDAR
jgi:hypothetical protein